MSSFNKKGYTKVDGKWYRTNFQVGDAVKRTTTSHTLSGIPKGSVDVVTRVSFNGYSPTYELNDYGDYENVYEQKVYLKGNPGLGYYGKHFEKVEAIMNTMQIEMDRPTFAQEFTETTVDGKAVRSYIGEPIPFDNYNSATVYTSNEISNSIRKDNTYRKFAIFVEKSIAQAKKPEIEFA